MRFHLKVWLLISRRSTVKSDRGDFFGDPAEWLGLVLSIFEPPMKLADISLGVLLILLVSDAIHPGAGILF